MLIGSGMHPESASFDYLYNYKAESLNKDPLKLRHERSNVQSGHTGEIYIGWGVSYAIWHLILAPMLLKRSMQKMQNFGCQIRILFQHVSILRQIVTSQEIFDFSRSCTLGYPGLARYSSII